MPAPVLIVNGPNLNMLGSREPEIYGKETLADIEKKCAKHADSLGLKVSFFQSNVEGELVSAIQRSMQENSAVIINAGAYSHTSVAIHDALAMLKIPVIEVHLSNIYKRESFRHHSFISPVATGCICGLGSEGYLLALTAIAKR